MYIHIYVEWKVRKGSIPFHLLINPTQNGMCTEIGHRWTGNTGKLIPLNDQLSGISTYCA